MTLEFTLTLEAKDEHEVADIVSEIILNTRVEKVKDVRCNG